MKRWHSEKLDYVISNKIDQFLEEIIVICKKYNLSISHEDNNGAFRIEKFSERNAEWLKAASINMEDIP